MGVLARVVAFDADLATAVFGVFADELARWQRERANDLGIADPQTDSLLEIQRFADGARLYPHAHALVPDGFFVASSDGLSARFIRQDPPSDDDVALVVSRVEQRLTRVLGRWRARRQRDSANDSDAANILPACAEVPRKLRRYRLDVVVDDAVVVELKTVERFKPAHESQHVPYLRLSGRRVGLLINFHVPTLKDGIKRLVL